MAPERRAPVKSFADPRVEVYAPTDSFPYYRVRGYDRCGNRVVDTSGGKRLREADLKIPPDFTSLSGTVEWVRLIRSDRRLRVLGHAYPMPEAVVPEYVTATLVVEDQELVVTHHDREIARYPFPPHVTMCWRKPSTVTKRCAVGTHQPSTGNDVLTAMSYVMGMMTGAWLWVRRSRAGSSSCVRELLASPPRPPGRAAATHAETGECQAYDALRARPPISL